MCASLPLSQASFKIQETFMSFFFVQQLIFFTVVAEAHSVVERLCPYFTDALGIVFNLLSAFPLQMVMTTHNSPGWLHLPPAKMLHHPLR